MNDTLVTVATFDNPIEMHLAKTKLQSEGIRVYIFDENTITLNPFFNYLVGGIKLKTDSSEAEKARDILKVVRNSPFTNEEDEAIKCPACNSEKIYGGFNSLRSVKAVLFFMLSIATVTYPVYLEKRYKCKSCGFEFKYDEESSV